MLLIYSPSASVANITFKIYSTSVRLSTVPQVLPSIKTWTSLVYKNANSLNWSPCLSPHRLFIQQLQWSIQTRSHRHTPPTPIQSLPWASQRGPAALSGLALTTSPASDSYLPPFPSSGYTTSFLPLKSWSSCLLRYICICCLFPPRTFFSRMLSSPHPSRSAQRSLPQVSLTIIPIIPLQPSSPTTALSQ